MLNAALKINPNDPAIANGYISYFKNSGRSNETAGFLEHTIKKYNIKSIYYARDLAQIYIMNNDTAKARAFIEASLDQYPDDNELLDWKNELRRIISFDKEGSDLNVSQKVTWYEDFEEALAKAKKEGKPILTQFYDHKNDYLFQKMNRDIFILNDTSLYLYSQSRLF